MPTRLSPTQVRVLRELARGNRLSAQLELRTGRWQLRVYLRWAKPPEHAPATVRRSTLWVLVNAGYIRPIHEGTHRNPSGRNTTALNGPR